MPCPQWNARAVLEIHAEKECIGWAPSKRRKCTCAISRANWESFKTTLGKLEEQTPDAEKMRPQLKELASLGLCVGNHRNKQVASTLEKWIPKINAAARAADIAQRSRNDTRSTTTSFVTARSSRTLSSRTGQSAPAVPSSATLPAPSEVESLEKGIEALREQVRVAERRLTHLQTSQAPLAAIHPVLRVATADIPALHLSSVSGIVPPPTTSTQSRTSRPTSPLSFVSSQSSSTSLLSDRTARPSSSSPSSSPASQSRRRRSATNSTSSESSTAAPQVSEQRPPQRTQPVSTASDYSLSPLSVPSDAQESSSQPPTPSTSTPQSHEMAAVPQCNRQHTRLRLLNEECPLCLDGESLSKLPASALVWCTSSCGRPVHATCFNIWEAQCALDDRKLDCPVCRADWRQSCGCGGRSNCNTVHVVRKAIEGGACSICKEEMKEGCERLGWCKDECGQNVHSSCMRIWEEECLARNERVTCTVCRAAWRADCRC